MKKLGELLVEQDKISERDVERTLLAQAEMGELFGQVLVKLGLVSEQDVAMALSEQLDIPLQLGRRFSGGANPPGWRRTGLSGQQ